MRVKNKYEYKYLALNIIASAVKRFRVFVKKNKQFPIGSIELNDRFFRIARLFTIGEVH